MDVRNRARLEVELARDEGTRPRMYPDSEGVPTIGVGHNLLKPLPQSVIDLLFEVDLDEALEMLDKELPWWRDMEPVRQRVLANMAFNLGYKLLGFKNTLAAMREGRWADAAKGMRESKWAKQVKGRAERLARMMESGQEPGPK